MVMKVIGGGKDDLKTDLSLVFPEHRSSPLAAMTPPSLHTPTADITPLAFVSPQQDETSEVRRKGPPLPAAVEDECTDIGDDELLFDGAPAVAAPAAAPVLVPCGNGTYALYAEKQDVPARQVPASFGELRNVILADDILGDRIVEKQEPPTVRELRAAEPAPITLRSAPDSQAPTKKGIAPELVQLAAQNRQRQAEKEAARAAAQAERARITAERQAASAEREKERLARVDEMKAVRRRQEEERQRLQRVARIHELKAEARETRKSSVTQSRKLETWFDHKPGYDAASTPSKDGVADYKVFVPSGWAATDREGDIVLRSPEQEKHAQQAARTQQAADLAERASVGAEIKQYTHKVGRTLYVAAAAAATLVLSAVFNPKAEHPAPAAPETKPTAAHSIPAPGAAIGVTYDADAQSITQIRSVTDVAGRRVSCVGDENAEARMSLQGDMGACAATLTQIGRRPGKGLDAPAEDCANGKMSACVDAARGAVARAPNTTVVPEEILMGGQKISISLAEILDEMTGATLRALTAPVSRPDLKPLPDAFSPKAEKPGLKSLSAPHVRGPRVATTAPAQKPMGHHTVSYGQLVRQFGRPCADALRANNITVDDGQGGAKAIEKRVKAAGAERASVPAACLASGVKF